MSQLSRDELENSASSRIPAEKDDGNQEYKLKLTSDKGQHRIDQMTTQMRFRVEEGSGEAIYTVGVTDSGGVIGLTEEEYKETYDILQKVAKNNNYTLTLLTENKVDSERTMYEFLVREHNETKYVDVKIACAGNVDSGKCFKKGTLVRKYDSSLEAVENIKKGDLLMGDDNDARIVLKTTTGYGRMYKVEPLYGEPFVVNKNHILCFKTNYNSHLYFDENDNRYAVRTLRLINQRPVAHTQYFPIGRLMLKPLSKEDAYACAKRYLDESKDIVKKGDVIELSVEEYANLNRETQNCLKLYRLPVEYKKRDMKYDPYEVGTWLGDTPNVSLGINIVYDEVSEDYKYNCIDVRKELLAGMIDSCGYIKDNKYILRIENETLTSDIIEIAHSLGYTCYKNERGIVIHGEELPTKVVKGTIKEPNLIPIKNIFVQAYQDYIGFEVDGNGRFFLKDYIVTHNSTLLGVLLSGKNDDGRGKARLSVFNFAHEVTSGRTSSVAQHILGFDGSGNVMNYNDELGRKKTWPDIVKNSDKIITFFDLCGHEPYLKTTIMGLTSQIPDLVFILVGANMGVTKMTKEHMFLCLSLKIPFVIILTKIDICENRQNVLKETVQDIKKLLKSPGIRRIPCEVKTHEDVMLASKNVNSFSVVPMFRISNVSGHGIDTLRSFLNLFHKRPQVNENDNKIELHVEQTFYVTGVGTVIGGQLITGKIRIGDRLLIGPNNNEYKSTTVKSIHVKRVSVEETDCGRYVCLALKKTDRDSVHRGNVLLSVVDHPYQVYEFEAEIAVLKTHSTTIKPGYQPVIHTWSIRQIAQILWIGNKTCNRKGIEDNILRTGDKATVKFRFCYRPEYVKEGFRILLAEGRVKVIGKITNVTKIKCPIGK